MTERSAAFEGSIPETYDRYLGPVFFEPYAADIVARLNPSDYRAVLEIACGTGIVTRRLRDRLGLNIRLVATDLNAAMFACAQKKFRPDEKIEWLEADATALPFPEKSFDAVVCQFGLMFVPEKEAALRETYRVLTDGGLFLFNVWDSPEHNPDARVAHTTIASFFPDDPPRFYEIPFGFHDEKLIRHLLTEAGFREIECSVVSLPCISPPAREFAIGLVRGNPVVHAIEERGGTEVDAVVEAVARELGYCFGERPSASTMQALVWRAVR